MIQLNINPTDATGNAIPGAIIDLRAYSPADASIKPIEPALRTQPNYYNGNDDQPYPFAPVVLYGTVRADGYKEALFGPVQWDGKATLDIPVVLSFKRPVVVPRAPLPAFDPDTTDPDSGAPLPVLTTINGTIPPRWTKDYLRSSLWSLELPYLPLIDGGASGAAQFRLVTYLLYAYPRALWPKIFKDYGAAGLEVFWLSIPDARDRNGGMTPQQYRDMTAAVLDSGLSVGHFLRSKDVDAPNTDPTLIEPYVDPLYASGMIPWGAFTWEASLFNTPAAYMGQIQHDARRWPSVNWGVHLQEGYADFGPDGEGHGPAFWKQCLSVGVRRLFYQYNADATYTNRPGCNGWSAGMMQARGNDVSTRLIAGGLWGLPETVDWFAFEQCGVQLFNNQADGDGRLASGDTARVKGYEALCTPGPLPPRGFGNDASYPDGRAI